MKFNRLLIEGNIGTLTSFVSDQNDFYGLSAFHVLRGNDGNIDDEDIIKIQNTTGRWINFGKTKYGRYESGNGQYGNFGKLDYAIFELHPTFKRRISNNIIELPISNLFQFTNLNRMIGSKVQAYSEENQKWISGIIKDIHHRINPQKLFDVIIQIENGIRTFKGDSGMLWKDEFGHALFMHTNGGQRNEIGFSYCTIISRITNKNNLRLVQINNELIS
jgi:hypothetical protein